MEEEVVSTIVSIPLPRSDRIATTPAMAVQDRERVEIRSATHYFENQPQQLKEATEAIAAWLDKHGFG